MSRHRRHLSLLAHLVSHGYFVSEALVSHRPHSQFTFPSHFIGLLKPNPNSTRLLCQLFFQPTTSFPHPTPNLPSHLTFFAPSEKSAASLTFTVRPISDFPFPPSPSTPPTATCTGWSALSAFVASLH